MIPHVEYLNIWWDGKVECLRKVKIDFKLSYIKAFLTNSKNLHIFPILLLKMGHGVKKEKMVLDQI